MIIDKIQNAYLYYGINDRIKKALEYIKNTDLSTLRNGKYEIDEENIFIIIQDYQSKPLPDGKWEAHKKYTDIQYIIKGKEQLGYLNINEFSPNTDYDKEKDLIFGEGNGSFLQAQEDYFLIFTPEDAHMPGIYINKPEYVKKAVVKIKVD